MYITKEELLEEGYDEGAIDAFIELFGEEELGIMYLFWQICKYLSRTLFSEVNK